MRLSALLSAALPSRSLICAAALGGLLSACGRGKEQPSPPARQSAATVQPQAQAVPSPPKEAPPPTPPAPPKEPEATETEPVAPQYSGPFLLVTDSSAGVYAQASSRSTKLGYLRRGERAPILPDVVNKNNCAHGWYQVVGGGFICANNGTTDIDSPKVKFITSPPDLDAILPYRYARNSQNGTPLYKSVPSPEQIDFYERKIRSNKPASSQKSARAAHEVEPEKSAKPSEEVDGGSNEKPWWQREDADKNLSHLALSDLTAEGDDVISQRMVKGFYVAIDKIFKWNNRVWYKTTKGLIAPADRLWLTDASDFKGVELKGDLKLPIGWVFGGAKDRPKYEIDPETKAMKQSGVVKHFESVALSGDELVIRGTHYVALSDGSWMKKDQLRITEPGAVPADVGADERWVDVDLSSQTLVAFIGAKPVYATMISSGKQSPIKEKDHSTPTGEWRIREKHLATTMDGDGTVAGDLPYSIEDVPYVMYFYKAYALHGAFWHRNYGVRMSHGCVNLAPLDAKYLFFFTGPRFPQGWHGVWATDDNPGSRVIIHD